MIGGSKYNGNVKYFKMSSKILREKCKRIIYMFRSLNSYDILIRWCLSEVRWIFNCRRFNIPCLSECVILLTCCTPTKYELLHSYIKVFKIVIMTFLNLRLGSWGIQFSIVGGFKIPWQGKQILFFDFNSL